MLPPERLSQPGSLDTSAMLRFVSDSALEALEGREYHSNRKDLRGLGALLDQLVPQALWRLLNPLHPLRLQAPQALGALLDPLRLWRPQDPQALADRQGLLDQLAPVGPHHPWVLEAQQAQLLPWVLQVLRDPEFPVGRSGP